MTTPILTEQWHDEQGQIVRQWYCEPPPAGVWFQIQESEWSDGDPAVERIFRVTTAGLPAALSDSPPGSSSAVLATDDGASLYGRRLT